MNKYLAIFGKPRYLGIISYDGHGDKLEKGGTVIAESYRGEETAVIAGELTEEQEKEYRQLKNAAESGDGIKSSEPVVTDLTFIKIASESDLETTPEFRAEEDEIFKQAKALLESHNLDMKLIDVEFLRKRRKLFFYFSSEQRVDFRAYVRDLAREFKTRIELRQIGVRDEAKIIRGISPCGLPCCCSYWLNQFAPINIRMVKEQNLALNPSKNSGICGRLMCCMHYEHNVYHELWTKLPNPGSKIKTPNGNVIVAGIDLASESARCFVPGRGEVKVPVARFEEFRQTVIDGKDWNIDEENGQPNGSHIRESGRSPRLAGIKKKHEGDAAGLTAESKKIQPRQERHEKAADTVASPLQPAKKKRRKRGRGGAAKPAKGQIAAAQTEKPHSVPDTTKIAGDGSVSRKPRRPRRRGREKPKNSETNAIERESGN